MLQLLTFLKSNVGGVASGVSDFIQVTPREIESVKDLMKENDITVMQETVKNKINKWKTVNLNCGITGSSGSGKSSFINAIRSMKGQDKGAAAVGVTETTIIPTPYVHPNNPKLIYWDLPGVGTELFPRNDTYLDKVGFEKYDFFLILSANRFTEDDIWLAQQIQKRGKRFYFVRSKLDNNLADHARNYSDTYNEEETISLIRKDITTKLQKNGFPNSSVYLVSNINAGSYDFPRLITELAESLPLHKKEAMTLSITSFSKQIISEKKKILQERIHDICVIDSITVVVSDISGVLAELKLYRKQFGLEQGQLKNLKISDKDKKYLVDITSEAFVWSLYESPEITKVVGSIARRLPVTGPYQVIKLLLHNELKKFEKIATAVMKQQYERMVDNV